MGADNKIQAAAPANPEIARSLLAGGVRTNYHDQGQGQPVLLIHGSGPGVSAWANWRLTMPALAQDFRVIAPDMAGFGFSERKPDDVYSMQNWVAQAVGLLDALDIPRAHVVGNSFGGALALALAIAHPQRVDRLVLMGSAGVPFAITPGLDAVWGYTPSIDNMKQLVQLFAHDRALVTDELAELRYRASIREGFQESFARMFPAPRQAGVDALASREADIRSLRNHTLIVHGREDRIIPLSNATTLLDWIAHAQLHVFGECGHWTQIEHAARFNRLVADFLKEAEVAQ